MLVAVVHRFHHVFGGLHFNGLKYESRYQLMSCNNDIIFDVTGRNTDSIGYDSGIQVVMQVDGNLTSYRHDPCIWLDAAYYQKDGRAMAWNGYQVGDSWIIEFRPAPLGLQPVVKRPLTLLESVRRSDHDGHVGGLLTLGDSSAMTPLLEWTEVDDTVVHSHFGFLWLHKRGSSRRVLIPKAVIQTVASKMVGVERNSKGLRTCIRLMQNCISSDKLNVPPDVMLDCKTYGVALAFIYSLDKEIVAFNELCSTTLSRKYSGLASVLQLQGLWKFSTKAVLALAGTAAAASVVMGKPSASRALIPIVGICAYKEWNKKVQERNRRYNGPLNTNYDVDRSSTPGEVADTQELWPEGLPGYESKSPLRDMRSQASVDCPSYEEEEMKPNFFPILPTFSEYIPIVPAATTNNELVSVVNRACMTVPDICRKAWKSVFQVAREELKLFDEISYDEGAYKEWNSKFLRGRQLDHDRAMEDLEINPLCKKDFIRSAFVKRELTLKGGEEPEEFDPRCIQGVSHRANVVLGPFMYKFSKLLHEKWNLDYHICYTSGCTAEELGSWRSNFGDEEVTIFEIDFSRYDAHQRKECHDLEKLFYKQSGIAGWEGAEQVFDAQSSTLGYTAHGVKYKVPYTRKSGDPNTSCGNSIINAMLAKTIMRELGFEFAMLVQGDDNLLVVRRRFSAQYVKRLEKRIVEMYEMFGFKIKLKIRTKWHEVEFCSSLFWPVEDGFILGPKIGRRLPKLGFSLKRLTPGQIKGMLLGNEIEMGHIPILRRYIRYCLKRMKAVKREYYYDREMQFKCLSSNKHSATDETIEFFTLRYGVNVEDAETELDNALHAASSSLLTTVSFPLLVELMAVDT